MEKAHCRGSEESRWWALKFRLAQEGSDEHKLAELKSEKDAAEENLEKTDEEIANIQQQVDCETKALESKRAEYSSIGGDIVSQRQEMLHQKTVLTMQLDQINEDLITDASGDLPLALVQNLLWKIKGQAETAQNDILSTDSEIDQHYYDLMKENVDDEYTLVYDDLSKSSSIICSTRAV